MALIATTTEQKQTAQSKLQQIIDHGSAMVMGGLKQMQDEFQIRRDLRLKPSALDIDIVRNEKSKGFRWHPVIDYGNGTREGFDMTPFARGQLLGRAEMDSRFVDMLERRDQGDLLRHNLRTLLPVTAKDGLLVREVKNNIRAILSPAYKCLDNALFFDTFVERALKANMVPYRGNVSDTRAFVSFVQREIIELTPGEYVVAGVEMRGSDYGRGAQEVNAIFVRLVCFNGMTGYDMFRKVHIGRRFSQDDLGDGVVELSRKTIESDVKTVRYALGDVMNGVQKQLTGLTEVVREAATAEIDVTKTLGQLKKSGLKAATVEKVRELYENEALPVEAMPQAPGAWRLSNALSLLANNVKDVDEAADLRDAAYGVMPLPTKQ